MGETTKCPICKQPVVAKLTDTLLAQGTDDAAIVATLKSAGVERVGPLSVSRHRTECREDSSKLPSSQPRPSRRPTSRLW